MISDVQKVRMMRAFRSYDHNNDGVVTLDDFTQHATKLVTLRGLAQGSPASKALLASLHGHWQRLAAMVDSDGDGRITPDEWMVFAIDMVHRLQAAVDAGAPWPLNAWIDSLYGVIDADGDGCITLQEYRDWCEALGIAGEMDVEGAFRGFDKQSPDRLTRDEFVRISCQFWLDPDPNTPGDRWVGP